jgi:hypothetical protein
MVYSGFESDVVPTRTCGLKAFFENSGPISAQNFFNVLIGETSLNQFSSEVPRVRMVPQVRNEMRCR